MEVDKQKFRDMIEAGRYGQALNQLSDVSHFLEQGGIQEKLQHIAVLHQEWEEMDESAAERESLQLKVKNKLLELVDQLPEEFSPGASSAPQNPGGCFGVLALLISLSMLALMGL